MDTILISNRSTDIIKDLTKIVYHQNRDYDDIYNHGGGNISFHFGKESERIYVHLKKIQRKDMKRFNIRLKIMNMIKTE